MNMPFLLLLNLFLLPELTASSLHRLRIPSSAEVLKTGHPLTIALYAGMARYQAALENNTISEKASSSLAECLKNHPVLSSPWIHEKKFSSDIAVHDQPIMPIIEANKDYQRLQPMTQDLLVMALHVAYSDCIQKHPRK